MSTVSPTVALPAGSASSARCRSSSLTRSPAQFAGRAFAAYAGVYLLGAMGWFVLLDGGRIDRWDLIGAGLSLAGALVVLYAPRTG